MKTNLEHAYLTSAILLSLFTISACNDSPEQIDRFADKLAMDFGLSQNAIDDVLLTCSEGFVLCHIKDDDVIMSYSGASLGEVFHECSYSQIKTDVIEWNISQASILFKTSYTHRAKDECNIVSYDIGEFEEYALRYSSEYVQNVPATTALKAFGNSSDGYSAFSMKATVTLDRSAFTRQNMLDLFIGDDDSHSAWTFVFLHRDISYSTYNSSNGKTYLEGDAFVQDLDLQIKSNSAKELFEKTW